MAIGDDFSIAENGDIRYTGTTTNYTVIDFHRWLGDLMDDAQASGNDLLDITDATASDRATDNLITLNDPYNIDDTAAEHLYDGSIVQDDGDTIYDGIVVIANSGMPLDILQNGSLIANDFWGSGLNADTANGISHRFMVKVRTAGADIDGRRLVGMTREWTKTYSEFKINGTARGNNVLALTYADDLNNTTANSTVATWTTIVNQTEGFSPLDVGIGDGIDENYYSNWTRDTYTINQFYERMKWMSQTHNQGANTEVIYGLAGNIFRGITHQIPIDSGAGTWGTPPNQDEVISWSGAGGPTGTGRLIAVNNTASTSATKIWMQILTGQAPTNNQQIVGGTSSANCLVNGTPTERPISTPFCGSSTGSAIIGAYGFGIDPDDLTNLDTLFDLDTNSAQNPPNNVQFAVGGLSTDDGGDRILVAPLGYYFPYQGELSGPFSVGETLTFQGGATAYLSELNDLGTEGFMKVRILTGSAPAAGETFDGGTSSAHANVVSTPVVSEDPRQLVTTIALSGAAETQAVMTTAIPSDSPSPGTVRIKMDSGVYKLCPYSSFTGNTFTFTTTIDFSGGNTTSVDSSAFISYVDKNATAASESFTIVYSANRGVFVRVRYGSNTTNEFTPIKTFETSGTITSSGGTSTAIRTADA